MGDMTFEQQIQNDRIPADSLWSSMLQKSPEWTTWEEEQLSWHKGVSLWQISGGSWFRFKGPDAKRMLSDLCVNSFAKNVPGTSRHMVMCRDDGKIILDTSLLVYGENDYEISSYPAPIFYELAKGGYDVSIEQSPERTTMQLAGPNAVKLLKRLTDADIDSIKYLHFNPEPIDLAGYPTILYRMTMAGADGFEVQVPVEALDDVITKIFEAGADLGVRRIGGRNHLSPHVESCVPLTMTDYLYAVRDPGDPFFEWAVEQGPLVALVYCPKISGSFEPKAYSDFYASPVDIGWKVAVHLDHDFRGKDALAKELEHPIRKMTTLEWNNEDVIDVYTSMFAEGAPHEEVYTETYDYMEMPRDPRLPLEASTVLHDGKPVAYTSSRTYSYAYKRMISLCMIPVELSEPGTQVEVVWGNPGHKQKVIRATVQTAPYMIPKSKN